MQNDPFSNTYTCLIPTHVNLDNLLQGNLIKVSQYQNQPYMIRDNIAFLINCISQGQHKITAETEYIPLSSTILQSVVRNYKEYITYLTESNIIITDNKYIPKRKNLGYKFIAPPSAYNTYYIYNPTIINKIKSSMKKNTPRLPADYDHLIKPFDDLSYDEDQAALLIGSITDQSRKERAIMFLSRIKNKDYQFSHDRAGRFYSPITSLPKVVRPALRWQNKPLVETDIKSAVPRFTLPLLDVHSWDDNLCETILKYNPNIIEKKSAAGFNNNSFNYSLNSNYTISLRDSTLLYSHIMLCKNDHRDEIDLYKSLILDPEKDLYSYLADFWNEDLKPKISLTRDDAKKRFLQILNSPPSHNNKYKTSLTLLFPTVLAIVDWVNTGYTRTKVMGRTKYDLACPFAHIGFTLESNYIIKQVTKDLSCKYPDNPFFSIHDSILSIAEDKSIISQIFNNQNN